MYLSLLQANWEKDCKAEFDVIVELVRKRERQRWKQGGKGKTTFIKEEAKPDATKNRGFYELEDIAVPVANGGMGDAVRVIRSCLLYLVPCAMSLPLASKSPNSCSSTQT